MTDIADTNTRAVVERYVAAVEAGDGATVRDTIIDEFLAGALGNYEPGSVRLEVTAIVADGDRAVVEWTSQARTLRGEPYENFCIGAFTVRDGKIQAVREYMDTAYAQRMLFAGDRAAA